MFNRIQFWGRRLTQLTTSLVGFNALTSPLQVNAASEPAYSFLNAEHKTYTMTDDADDPIHFRSIFKKLKAAIDEHQFNLTALDYDASSSSNARIAVLCSQAETENFVTKLSLYGQEGASLSDAGLLEFSRYAQQICEELNDPGVGTKVFMIICIVVMCCGGVCFLGGQFLREDMLGARPVPAPPCELPGPAEGQGHQAEGRPDGAGRISQDAEQASGVLPAPPFELEGPIEGQEFQAEGRPGEFVDLELGLLGNQSPAIRQGEPSVSPIEISPRQVEPAPSRLKHDERPHSSVNNSLKQGEASPTPATPKVMTSPYRAEGARQPSSFRLFTTVVKNSESNVCELDELSPGLPYHILKG